MKTRWQNGEANVPEGWDIEKLRRCKKAEEEYNTYLEEIEAAKLKRK